MEHDGVPAARLPVFVDGSGRRGRVVRRVCWALGLLMGAYVAVVLLALVGPPGLSRLAVPGLGPVLPGAAAPDLRTGSGRRGTPAVLLSPSRPTPSPARPTASSLLTPAPRSSNGAVVPAPDHAPPSATAPSRASAGPTPSLAPSAAPSPRPTRPAGTPKPRSSRVPPGQASAHPSPHSTNAHGGKPSPTP